MREVYPSLVRMCDTWVCTVRRDSSSSAAMSGFALQPGHPTPAGGHRGDRGTQRGQLLVAPDHRDPERLEDHDADPMVYRRWC
jgi:hypothetical protein